METSAGGSTTAESDQGTKGLFARRWLERMNSDYEKRLWEILEHEDLGDLSQFHKAAWFDEVPLFSREHDIAFLPSQKDTASQILLRFALKFLKAVIAYEDHPTGYFAAITTWSTASDPLIPYIFAWCGDVRELEHKLSLSPPSTPFAEKTSKLLSKVDLTGAFQVGEDAITVPGETRLFIAPEQPPYDGFLPLSALQTHKAAKFAQ